MSGFTNICIRNDTGEISLFRTWSRFIDTHMRCPELCQGDISGLNELIDFWAVRFKHPALDPFIAAAYRRHHDDPVVLGPYDYGLIVIDKMTNSILSMQHECRLSQKPIFPSAEPDESAVNLINADSVDAYCLVNKLDAINASEKTKSEWLALLQQGQIDRLFLKHAMNVTEYHTPETECDIFKEKLIELGFVIDNAADNCWFNFR